jgi:hypothetical protein
MWSTINGVAGMAGNITSKATQFATTLIEAAAEEFREEVTPS